LENPELATELSTFLVLSAIAEGLGYPALAKMFHREIGTFASTRCRAIDYDISERFWALQPILGAIVAGSDRFREKIRPVTDS
jgi:4-hydroxy-tetrahydrodipicolinate synthase